MPQTVELCAGDKLVRCGGNGLQLGQQDPGRRRFPSPPLRQRRRAQQSGARQRRIYSQQAAPRQPQTAKSRQIGRWAHAAETLCLSVLVSTVASSLYKSASTPNGRQHRDIDGTDSTDVSSYPDTIMNVSDTCKSLAVCRCIYDVHISRVSHFPSTCRSGVRGGGDM